MAKFMNKGGTGDVCFLQTYGTFTAVDEFLFEKF
jgi:hypothetical protein